MFLFWFLSDSREKKSLQCLRICKEYSSERIFCKGFCYKEEIARGRYCQASSVYPCQPGKNYYGRGPIQITWNENYGAAGKFLGLPLLTDPDMVARNPDVAFKCAMWFWNEKVRPVVDQGFGATTRRINGGECDGGSPTRVQSRVNRYLEFCRQFGISSGTSLSC
ncbi:hypothetical protein F2Q70_00024551 [Brassica cretica]|uniref:Glycoside hydrolase family 19 catalytic domain-containing protein n=1 Tax=Brassica cretica TaxID=69181 RepID=A0A8S9L3W6_BRACR|nr:hypothetical protein F2Q70_00024551 [Brassica cretica]